MIITGSTEISSLLAHSVYSDGSSFLNVYTDELVQEVSQTAGENLSATDGSVTLSSPLIILQRVIFCKLTGN